MLAGAEIRRVLAVAAHPDDLDFGAAGTIAGWTARGVDVTYCIATDGDAGGFDPAVARSEIPAIRRKEQLAAADAVGVADVRFLGYRDGELTVTAELRRDISRAIRQVRPDIVLLPSPERDWDRIPGSHPDHLACGEAAMHAVYPDARNPWAHSTLLADEGLEAWTVREVWVMAHHTRDHVVDITDTFPAKLAALRAHESQTGHMPELEAFLRGWGEQAASAGGLPEGRLGEGFFVRTMPA